MIPESDCPYQLTTPCAALFLQRAAMAVRRKPQPMIVAGAETHRYASFLTIPVNFKT